MTNLTHARPLFGRPRWLITAGVIAVLGVIALMSYLIWGSYREAILTAETTSRNYAAIIEARLDATLRRADAHLQELVRDVPIAALSKQAVPRYAGEIDGGLDLRLLNFPELAGLRVLDADGDLLYTTSDKTTFAANAADREYFHVLRDNLQAGLVISEVLIGRVTGRAAVILARASRDQQNVFRGIMLGSVDLDYFEDLFRSLNVGANGVISVLRTDDFRRVARFPRMPSAINRPLPPDNRVRTLLASGERTMTFETVAASDGVARISSIHPLDRYPFFVVVALAREDVLAGWKIRTLLVGLAGALLLLVLGCMLYWLWRAGAQQEQALIDMARSEANLRALSDNASVGILVLLEGRCVFANRHAAQLLGYTIKELEQLPAIDAIHPDYRAVIMERHRRRMAGEDVISCYESMALTKDGRAFPVELNAAATLWNGQSACMVFFSDITTRNQIEAALREAQKMEALGKLTGGMAHDCNNYLGVIIGSLDALREEKAEGPAAVELIDAALAGALHAAELIKSLLAFARQQPLAPQRTDISHNLDTIVALLRRTLGEDITLKTAVAPDLWPVWIDRAQLDSCIVNLANNARDAMPSGGLLVISARNVQIDQTHAKKNVDAEPGDYVLIEISDTGAGMSPDTVVHAFEPFFTTKPAGHGTGLGLSIVYGFVKQSGGHINIYSEVGHGTTVRIYLPRHRDATDEAAVATEVPAAARVGRTETILVVEDNAQMRRTVVRQLVSLGYRVIEAENGAAALEILERGEPQINLLFTDIVMPDNLDGYELARCAMEKQPDIKVVFTSGFPGDTLRHADNGMAAMALLSKPYRISDLERVIRTALDSAPARPDDHA